MKSAWQTGNRSLLLRWSIFGEPTPNDPSWMREERSRAATDAFPPIPDFTPQ